MTYSSNSTLANVVSAWRQGIAYRRLPPAERERRRRQRIAEEARRELQKPPLSEWEVMAGYAAVEAERRKG